MQADLICFLRLTSVRLKNQDVFLLGDSTLRNVNTGRKRKAGWTPKGLNIVGNGGTMSSERVQIAPDA